MTQPAAIDQRELKAAIRRMKLEPMRPRPLVKLETSLPQEHREKLQRFSTAEVSAMRVKAQRLLDEATEPSGKLLTDEQEDALKEAAALFIVTAGCVLLEAGSNLLMAWLDAS